MSISSRSLRAQQRHQLLPSVLALVIMVILLMRLFYLQILSPEFKAKARRNAFYEKIIYPDRGVIYDRNGKLVVYNEPAFDLLVTTAEMHSLDTLFLASLLGIDKEEVKQKLVEIKDKRKNPGYSVYTPQLLFGKISAVDAGRLQEQLFRLPGITIQPHSIRKSQYPNAALLLGYMGETTPTELANDSTLRRGEYIGKNGIERFYDKQLRGEKGVEIFLRDASGRIKGVYNEGKDNLPGTKGKNLILSIDIELQALGERLMEGKRGAIVMIEPATGEILCLVSAPSYDPDLLMGTNLGKNHKLLEQMPGKPLFNRAIQGAYPPGSTFKVPHAAILLEEGVITPTTTYPCHRGYPVLRNRPACHSHPSPVAVAYSITTSCNAFYCWGLRDFLDDRSRYPSVQEAFEVWKNRLVKLGLGYRLGVDLPGEKRGYLPNSKVYDKVYKGRWSSSSIISNAIGQGEILLTPLQMAHVAAIAANRGTYYVPHVVKQIEGDTLSALYLTKQYSGVKAHYWEHIVEGMAGAVTGGTCRGANFAPGEIEVCGKTGTAENRTNRDHSAFIGFAPKDHPAVAIAVYVEHGGFGAVYGVPIGRVMMEYYLRKGELSGATQAIANRIANQKIPYYDVRD